MKPALKIVLSYCYIVSLSHTCFTQNLVNVPDIPDSLIVETYRKAAMQNVLAAVNPEIFYGYFSVCADGIGFGYGNTYPSLDGHQMSDALLWLGQVDVVKANWDYVKGFQKSNGALPLAIFPSKTGEYIGPKNYQSKIDPNGGLYQHWVPGDPLRVLAVTTYIQNAEVIFRFTRDREWLLEQLTSVNLAADYLEPMITPEGMVAGAGYYIERPTRIEYDGVSQCHAAEALYHLAELNLIAGNKNNARKYNQLALLIEKNFRKNFWVKEKGHYAEYIHPEKGKITDHGLTDADWSSLATKMASSKQKSILWPALKNENRFYYNGMPTGIATHPETYELWEMTYPDKMDLAAMGRVWYVESCARANMNDGEGLLVTIRRVCKEGSENGYYWRERYNDTGGYGAEKYNEYPANLIRIIQRFLLGIEHGLDGTLYIGPTVPEEFWNAGFGQTLDFRGSQIAYTMGRGYIHGKYTGKVEQKLSVRFNKPFSDRAFQATVDGETVECKKKDGWISILLPARDCDNACNFEIKVL